MTISDEDVQAYVDGELPPDGAARIEAAIADDVLVAARVERAKRLRSQVRGASEGPAAARPHGDMPGGRVARRTATVASASIPRTEARPPARRWRLAAIALVAAVAAVAILRLRMPQTDIEVRGGALYARAGLAKRLDTALSASPDAASTFAIGLTFRDSRGHVCRSFVSTPARIAGLACRDGDAWALPVVSHLDHAIDGTAAASAYMPVDVLAAVSARMQGGAFDDRREREARESGWR